MVWLSAHGVCGFQHLFYRDRCLIAQNAQSTVVGEQRQVNTDDRLRLGRSLALPSGSSVGPLSTSLGMAVRQYSSAEANNAPMGGQLPGLCGNRWPGRNDAEDKSRSLGFSPGTNFASLLKSPVFFNGWGRAGMLGLHFVLGVKNARVTLTSSGQPQRTKPVVRALAGHRSAACLLPPLVVFR